MTNVDVSQWRVPIDQLRWQCDPNQLNFTYTEELVPLKEFIGQGRAIQSLEFGLAVERAGYNIFVTGLTGTGKASAIKDYVRRAVERRRARTVGYYPDDWCYVHNFAAPDRPEAIHLPRGYGKRLRDQVQELREAITREFSRVFGSEEYQRQRQQILEEGRSRHQALMQALEREARSAGFFIQLSPMGVNLIPMVGDRPMTPEEFMALPESARAEIQTRQAALMQRAEAAFEQARALEKEAMQKIRDLWRRLGEAAVAHPFRDLLDEYRGSPDTVHYLENLRDFVLDNIALFQEPEQAGPPQPFPLPLSVGQPRERDPFLPFQVNVFVDNSASQGPPIIVETNPTWGNMFGKIERRAFMGTYVSDHTMLKPGAVHLANQGYLILNIRDVLLNPGVWEALKRVIRTREARLEEPYEQFGFLAPQGLRPEPIPLDIKVIVMGDNILYQLLARYDEDLWEMFKVKAEFDFQIDRTDENLAAYAAFVCSCCEGESLLHFDNTAVAEIVEYGARLVSDQYKLSARFGQIKDILVESDYWARQEGADKVSARHVQKAIAQKVYRVNLIEERIRELIAQGTLMVDVEGAVVGQVNGLSVYDLGDFSFGRPSRITAETFMGRRGVINIERESQLSGRIHDKGVLILSGYLGYKYAQNKPLSLSASLTFEQSYEGVEGDSAASTELYAILSSLSGLPIQQNIAITGSVNQKGEIQPIGGVNEKIEGFFDVCRVQGLTGNQGVLIPQRNVRNLMLRDDVVEAVRQGQFHIYAVSTVDEGIEVLTGVPAGERQPDGTYPEGTVNYLVDQKLKALAEGIRGFYSDGRSAED